MSNVEDGKDDACGPLMHKNVSYALLGEINVLSRSMAIFDIHLPGKLL